MPRRGKARREHGARGDRPPWQRDPLPRHLQVLRFGARGAWRDPLHGGDCLSSELSALQKQAEQALDRLADLRRRGAELAQNDNGLVAETLEELGVALHELQVSTEELHEQTEALAASQESLRAERRRYHDLFNFAPDGYVVTDAFGMIRESNLAASALLGLPPEQLPGRPLPVFWPVKERRALRNLIARMARENAGIATIETRMKSGGAVALPVVLRVVRTQDRSGVELRWTLRDVSVERGARQALLAETAGRQRAEQSLVDETAGRQRAEQSLLESATRYRYLVEHATDLVFELDESGRFVFCNDRATRAILGYRRGELVGRALADLMPGEGRRAMQAFVDRLFKQPGTPAYCEFAMHAKDGRLVWLGQHATAIPMQGKGTKLQAVCRDITAQVERIERLQRSGERWRDLSGHLQTQIESEKAGLAREIHDELGAALTAIRMSLLVPGRREAAEKSGQSANFANSLRLVDAAIDATRRICSDLRPSLLDNLGLCAAIEWLAQDVQERVGLRCEAKLQGLREEPEPA